MKFDNIFFTQIDKKSLLKKFFATFCTLTIFVGVLIFLLHKADIKNEMRVVKSDQKIKVSRKAKALASSFVSVISDLKYLSRQQEFLQYLNQDDDFSLWDLQYDYLLFSSEKKIYDKIRILDEVGREIVYIKYKNGKPYVLQPDQLKNKSDRSYYEATKNLKRGEVYISPFDLSYENGDIEHPLKPTIRFATPTYDNAGNFRGILILNFLGSSLTEKLINARPLKYERISLLNSDGYWLYSQYPEKVFGFRIEGNNDTRYQKYHQEAWQQIKGVDYHQFSNEGGLFTSKKIYPFAEAFKGDLKPGITDLNKRYYWILVSEVLPTKINLIKDQVYSTYLNAFIIIFFLIAITAWIYATATTKRKSVEQALKESEKLIGSIMNSAHDAIMMTDENGAIHFWNQAAEAMLGYSKDEAAGKKMHELITPGHFREKHKKAFEEFQKSKDGKFVGKTAELIAITKKKVELPIEVSISAVELRGKRSAIAILRDITERKHMESTLQNIAMGVMGSSSDEVFHSLATYLAKAIEADYVLIGETIEGKKNIVKTISAYAKGKYLDNFEYDLTASPCDEDVAVGAFFCSEGIQNDFPDATLLNEWKAESYIGTPLYSMNAESGTLGVMVVLGCKPLAHPDLAEMMLQIFSLRAITEFERRGVEKERECLLLALEEKNITLEEISITDGLTGFYNHKYIITRLSEEISVSKRYQTPLSIIMFDIDHFKNINDSYGHQVGDYVLVEISNALKANLRQTDLSGRYGGEEFLMILKNTAIEDAYFTAEKVRKKMAEIDWGSYGLHVTISGGVAMYTGETVVELIAKADKLLYKAKNGGRNRIEFR